MRGASDPPRQLSELVWLPIVDAYRTFCIAPPPQVRVLFESLRGLRPAARVRG
jgi:hypothetical protein